MLKGISRRLKQILAGSRDPVLPESADPTLIKTQGWRQGSILPRDLLRTLIHDHRFDCSYWSASELNSDSDIGVVISQDCDVVNLDFEKEPYVEILVSRLISSSPQLNAYRHGRHPRQLIFDVHKQDVILTYEASIHDRLRIPRQYLITHAPDSANRIALEQRRIIILWLVKRYSRRAFPDEFNKRLGPSDENLKKFAKRYNKYLSAIRIRIEPFGEIGEDEDYRVIALLLVDQRKLPDFVPLPDLDEMEVDFEITLNECEGIEVDKCDVVMEEDLSLTDSKEFPVWDIFDYLSLSADQESDIVIPPE